MQKQRCEENKTINGNKIKRHEDCKAFLINNENNILFVKIILTGGGSEECRFKLQHEIVKVECGDKTYRLIPLCLLKCHPCCQIRNRLALGWYCTASMQKQKGLILSVLEAQAVTLFHLLVLCSQSQSVFCLVLDSVTIRDYSISLRYAVISHNYSAMHPLTCYVTRTVFSKELERSNYWSS